MTVLGIWICMFLGFPDPHSDPLVTSTDPGPALDPSIIKQKKLYLDGVGEQLTGRGHLLREVILVIVVRLPVVVTHLLFKKKSMLHKKVTGYYSSFNNLKNLKPSRTSYWRNHIPRA
jgi:hypothetical protein